MSTQLPNDFDGVNVQKKPARALGGWLILLVAVLAGLGAAYLAVHTLRSREEAALENIRASQKQATIRVVVPTRDVPAGAILDLSMVAARPIPSDTAPSDVITPESFDSFAGHRVNVPLQEGRPILASYLSGRRTLADLIAPDKLAMTFSVDNLSSLDGMLQPGDHVDVLWFYDGEGENGRGDGRMSGRALPASWPNAVGPNGGMEGAPEGMEFAGAQAGGPLLFRSGGGTQESRLPKETVRYLERDLKVIATGNRTVGDDSAANLSSDPAEAGRPAQFGTVTVELTPEQIQKLAMAKRLGSLQLVLRSHDSKVVAPAKVYSVRDILGIRGRSGGGLYAADAIEYIVGGTGTNGQLTARLDVRNLRRIAEATGRVAGRPGSDAYGLRQAAGADRPTPIDELLPPVNPYARR